MVSQRFFTPVLPDDKDNDYSDQYQRKSKESNESEKSKILDWMSLHQFFSFIVPHILIKMATFVLDVFRKRDFLPCLPTLALSHIMGFIVSNKIFSRQVC